MFLPGLTVSNEAFVKQCKNNMFWSVDSFEVLDQQTMAIDLIDRIRYGTTLILRDGTWDPEHVSRIRLYRICPGAKELPEGRMTTEDFVSWCMMKEKELGFPVLVVWAVEQDSPFDPEDCWQATIQQGTPMMLKVRDLAHLDLFEKIAGAFTSGCRSPWYELPKDLKWYYFDNMFSYAHDLPLQDGGNQYSELVDRLILKHRKVGDVSPVLVCLNGQRYEPALLNPATGEGYRIRMLRGERISMHAVSVSPAVRIVRGWGGASNPGYKPETVYTIKAWRLPEKNRLVIDIRIETSTATYMDDAWYRLDLHELFERFSTRKTAILVREATTKDAPPQVRWTSKYEYFIREISDRYWSWNIFSNPWINRQGELEFLNNCSLLPFWIIRIGVRTPDE